jgi:hypothetical protein
LKFCPKGRREEEEEFFNHYKNDPERHPEMFKKKP